MIAIDKKKIALFDLDHTLLPLDSDFAWGEFTQAIGWTGEEFRRRNDEFFEHYKAGTLDIHDYVRFATQAARERGAREALAAQERYMREVILPNLRPVALELVQSHARAGELPVIVTATNDFVTAPIAKAFGVHELIAVKLARDADGWITGEIEGVPSFREGKVTRIEQWLADRGWGWGDVQTTFYSDSMNDLPLLERVNVPVATNPDERLRAIAAERGWRILDLFESH